MMTERSTIVAPCDNEVGDIDVSILGAESNILQGQKSPCKMQMLLKGLVLLGDKKISDKLSFLRKACCGSYMMINHHQQTKR